MDVSKNRGIPKSSILIGFSIINHPFWSTPIFGNTHNYVYIFVGWGGFYLKRVTFFEGNIGNSIRGKNCPIGMVLPKAEWVAHSWKKMRMCLVDHPRTCKWSITMVNESPK